MTNKEESWHVVGKANKPKNPQQILQKERKAWLDNMPKMKSNDPIKDTGTMFDAFIKKQKGENGDNATKIPAAPTSKIPTPNGRKVAVDKKKKAIAQTAQPTISKKKPKMTFDEAVRKIQRKKLEAALEECQAHFPNSREVWMKDVASYLGLAMDSVPDPDPVYKSRPPGFPHCDLNDGCQQFLKELMAGSDKETLSRMFYFCVQVIMSEVAKGHPAHGYRMFLQSIALHRPDIINTKLQQYVDMVKENHQKPLVCLSILWCVGQCGLNNIRKGLKLWLDVMVPFLTVKHTAHYSILYLEHVLRGEMSDAYGVMTTRDFFPLLDLIFGNTADIQSDLKVKLVALYPKLKQISIKDQPEKSLHLFFPSFLTRATPQCTGAFRAEVLSCLMTCLALDPQSFSVWRQMYMKHLPQSGVLLSHMNQKWGGVKKRLGEKYLMPTIHSFSVTNEELQQKNNHEADRTGCSRICKNMLNKKTETARRSWFWILPLITTVVAAIIAYDVYTAKTFRNSRTLGFMEEYGILAFGEKVYTFTHHYTIVTATWLRVNVPIYSHKTYVTVVPYIQSGIHKANETMVYLVDVSRPHRAWLVTRSVEGYHAVYAWWPQLWDSIPVYLWLCIDTLRGYLTLLWGYTIQLSEQAAVWLNQHIFTNEGGTVGEILSNVRTTIHTHMLRTYEWCNAVVTSWR